MTYAQADQLHESWRQVETRQMTLTDFLGEAFYIQHRELDAEVLFPYGWDPPEVRAKVKAAAG